MTDQPKDAETTLIRLRELHAAQLALVWPAAERTAATSAHEPLVDLIKVYTANQAIDFAIVNRPDPNAATRVPIGFRAPR